MEVVGVPRRHIHGRATPPGGCFWVDVVHVQVDFGLWKHPTRLSFFGPRWHVVQPWFNHAETPACGGRFVGIWRAHMAFPARGLS